MFEEDMIMTAPAISRMDIEPTFVPEMELTHHELFAQFVMVPDQLEAALAGLTESDLDVARTLGTWTIREIAHHIVDADDIAKMIVKAALGHSGCTFGLAWYDSNNVCAQTLDYASRPIAADLALMRANHHHIEQLLCELPDAWDRVVMLKRDAVSEINRLTVSQLIYSQIDHTLHHIEQIRITRQEHGL
jgi:hypothetical protein